MVAPVSPPAKSSKGGAAKLYAPIGFKKGYNFVLWFIFAGAMLGCKCSANLLPVLCRSCPLTITITVVLARVMYLDFNGKFCPAGGRNNGSSAAPGECYYYNNFLRYKVGILLHLAGILPASALAVVQFTPFIRQRWILIHRVCGYLAIFLYVISLVGVFMIARHSMNGSLDVQAWCGFVGLGVLACFGLSVYNIRVLQIEQHRAWMLRGWFYVRGTPFKSLCHDSIH
jgi:hypothetical protein